MTTRTRRHLRPALRAALTAALLAAAAAGCGGGGEAAVTAPSPAVTPTGPAAATPTDSAPAPVETSGASIDAASDICATVPSLEVINAQLDEPVLRLTELDRGPGWALCEAAGDGVANVQFSILADSSRDEAIRLAEELGSTVVELTDPALPGAIAYSGAVSVFIGTSEYTVQAITLDTISDPSSEAAIARSAALLAAWLQGLGL